MPIMQKPFQRIGSISNSQVGRDFEVVAQRKFAEREIHLQLGHSVEVGIGTTKKIHAFDLGCSSQMVLVECKSHTWTSGHNVPSAKLTTWNEAMYYFHCSPLGYKKIMFVLRDLKKGNGESLATYYLRTYGHLIPTDVEFWEYDLATDAALHIGI